MNEKVHGPRRSDPRTGSKETQLQVEGSLHAAVEDTVRRITKLTSELEGVPKVVEDVAPEAYAKTVLPLIAEVRQRSERLGRLVADAELMRHAGRGRRTGALTLQQIADGLGVARSTVARWRKEGPLTAEFDDVSDPTAGPEMGVPPGDDGGQA